MIKYNKSIPDNIFVLEKCESLGDYSRLYGDEIAEHFENFDIIYIPYIPIDCDLSLIQSLTFPKSMAKIGSLEGLDKNFIIRNNDNLSIDQRHILNSMTDENNFAVYLQNQISLVNWQIKLAVQTFLPRYYSLEAANISWRLTDTVGDGLHFDYYHDNLGKPFALKKRKDPLHKIKLFINIDSKPRIWHTSMTLPEYLKNEKDNLPNILPDEINLLNSFISTKSNLKHSAYHTIKYPQLSGLLVNSEAVSHHIVSGSRVICGNFISLGSDMLNPDKIIYKQLSNSLKYYGYQVATGEDLNKFYE